MENKEHLAYVDGLRAVAVLSVLLYHAYIAGDATYPMWTICGSRGVDLFFVISGFCLAYPFLAKWRAGKFRMDRAVYGGFMLRRFSRIAPPYYVALTLFALLALTPFGFPNASHQSTALPNAVHDYFFDLAFLTGKSPLFNASFWTLGIEWRWYLLCPLLIALYVRTRLGFFAVGAVLSAAYNFLPLTIADEGTLPCFMAGILAADIAIVRHPWRRFAWIALAIALPVAVAMQLTTTERDLGDPIWHLASFCLVVAGGTGVLARVLTWRPIAMVGVASYSIYLIHGPIIESLVRAGIPPVLAGLGGLAAGFAAYYAIERPLSQPAFRKALEARLTLPVRLRGGTAVQPQA